MDDKRWKGSEEQSETLAQIMFHFIAYKQIFQSTQIIISKISFKEIITEYEQADRT